MAHPRRDFEHLPVAERIQLVEDLWDSIADAPDVLDLAEAQRAELQGRFEAHRASPDETIPRETP